MSAFPWMDHHSHQFTNACWQMGRMDVPDKGSWEAVLQEKSRGGRTGRYFQIFWAKQITLSYQRKSLSGDKPEEFPAFDRILYLRNLRVAALSATELEVRVALSLCHLVTLPPCHLATLSLLPVTLSTFQTVEGSNRLLWILMWSLFNLKWAKTSHQFNVWRKAGNWKVMWDEPEPELSHGTVIRYNIGYKQVDDDGDDGDDGGGGGLFWSKKFNYFERLSDIFESVSVVVSLIPLFSSLDQRAHTSSTTSIATSGIKPGVCSAI